MKAVQVSRGRIVRQLIIMLVTLLAIAQAVRAVWGSVERHLFLNRQSIALRKGQRQAEIINRELRDGLTSYRSSSGIERLARERLNLAGPDELIVRISR